MSHKVIVIGGGAAGFFAAITCAQSNSEAEVILFEKSRKLLQKVKVSGGGRCNVTHECFDIKQLSQAYPRGEKQLKSAFSRFNVKDTINWFNSQHVKLKTEADGRMFPVTDNSQTIIDALMKSASKVGVRIKTETGVRSIIPGYRGEFELILDNGERITCHKVIVATGGSPKPDHLSWLKDLGHTISQPVPSLFTFNIPGSELTSLQGISLNNCRLRIERTKLETSGPVLITHWGLSGPAILKLSSIGARQLAEMEYSFHVIVSWLNDKKEEAMRQELMNLKAANPNKNVLNLFPFLLPKRLASYLTVRAGISEDAKWSDISKEDINRLINFILYDMYEVKGKTTFKEEFVTCGGVSLDDIDFRTMESRRCKGLYFAGEVLDIDAITGGFNFQAAWTTGFIAGKAASIKE